jgi:hypothetical protein
MKSSLVALMSDHAKQSSISAELAATLSAAHQARKARRMAPPRVVDGSDAGRFKFQEKPPTRASSRSVPEFFCFPPLTAGAWNPM